MTIEFDPKKHCGGKTRASTKCKQRKGHRTNHPGSGNCRLHGGNTPNGKKHAQVEAVKTLLADLAVPVSGNPLQVLQAVLDSAHGVMHAARRMLAELPREADVDEKAWARLKLYRESIEAAGRMAKLAAEAVNEDALVQVDLATGEVLHRVLVAALDAYEGAGHGTEGRKAAEDALVRELVAVAPTTDERN